MPDHSDTVLRTTPGDGTSFRVVSLFTGIGGLDLGLQRAGHRIIQMSENWTPATRVLRSRFPDVPLAGDVREFRTVEGYDLLTAGFPCTDLSQAGRQQGVFGPGSGLVRKVFRIVEETPGWILLENVPNLLRLGRGAGSAYIVDRLASLGYSWASRVLDSRFTGLPQRRRRVFIVASRSGDPASVLLAGDTATTETPLVGDMQPHGFYWTEGRRGAGGGGERGPDVEGRFDARSAFGAGDLASDGRRRFKIRAPACGPWRSPTGLRPWMNGPRRRGRRL